MTTYQPGDEVICVDATTLTWSQETLNAGQVYVVREVTDNNGIRLVGSSVAWMNERFSPGKRAAAENKVRGEAPAEGADSVNHPTHYRLASGVEVIDLTEQLDFLRGNAVKYLARAGRKDGADELEDLRKAGWYVTRAISKLEQERSA